MIIASEIRAELEEFELEEFGADEFGLDGFREEFSGIETGDYKDQLKTKIQRM